MMLAWKCASTQSRYEGDWALFSSQTLRALTGAHRNTSILQGIPRFRPSCRVSKLVRSRLWARQ